MSAKLDREALIGLILNQAILIASLRTEIDALQRSGKRQAAPFFKGTRVEKPKTPGRKPGQGRFKQRRAPAPEQLSEPPIDVPVLEPACTHRGGLPLLDALVRIIHPAAPVPT